MGNLAFISHSSVDAAIANKIVVELEKNGIPCWIAPRNIQSGTTYAAAIVQGIKKSNRFILVFSQSSNNSDAVVNEIENANALKLPIIPFKIDNEPYSDSLDYYLRSKQSIAAYDKSIDQAVADLIRSVNSSSAIPLPTPPVSRRPRLKKWIIPAILILLIGVFATIYFANNNSKKDPPITVSFLKGTWLNEFNNGGASETVKIGEDGRYYVNGVYSFIVNNFEYDKDKKQIRFIKASVLDPRRLLNILTITDNNLLVGTESNYSIKYTRLSD